ncbi:hypothetical protein SBDP1_200015 [Syntrophobacter sp. SbD1]|nr:hypothetical protein SBDP1_200015 [Syntrophobacter sp. SbD1]
MKVELAQTSLHVEKVNAQAMIEGYKDNLGIHRHVSIFAATGRATAMQNDFRRFPKLITRHKGDRSLRDYPMSVVGKNLNDSPYIHKLKYIAMLDTIFYLNEVDVNNKVDMKMLKDLCTSGIFDIWEPIAPHNRFLDKKFNAKQSPMILLVRIWELERDFRPSEIDTGITTYWHTIIGNTYIEAVRPILSDAIFRSMKDLITSKILPYKKRIERVL